MKKIVSLLVALLCVGAASACMKKVKGERVAAKDFTVIVMDSTQALLSDAQIKVGKTTYTSSFDGRIVLKPEQVSGVKSLTITREGYESKKLSLGDASLEIVTLKAKPGKKDNKDKEIYYTLGATSSRSVHEKSAVMMATADMAVPEAVVEEGEMHILPYLEGEVEANDVAAGKLTAGEVNDFAKWSLWPKIMDGSHKQFVSTWRLEPRQRYTVQVKTKDGYPVANYPVQLKDTKGNTVFQALTDNTGKAELWNGLTGKPAEVNQPAWQTIVLDEPCEVSESVDVVFVFDATGSMGDELRYLQAEMNDVIARASAATGGLKIRTGAVVYRDHHDEYLTRISRLTDDIKTTQAFIDKQEANGGGDYPEAVPEALMAALNSAGWNDAARARIAFLILDAPCHEDSATVALLHEQILNAAAYGVRVVPVVCSGVGESGEYLLRSIALATNGTSFFLTDDSGIGHTHLKPTTDSLKVEHLNDMLVRTIVEYSKMPECQPLEESEELTENEYFLPNPFDAQELENDPTIPHGEGVHYLIDVSGKLLGIFEGIVPTDHLPVGVYFIKTYYDGIWHTKKILVR